MKYISRLIFKIIALGGAYLIGSLIEGSFIHWGIKGKISLCIWFLIVILD